MFRSFSASSAYSANRLGNPLMLCGD